ncbi:MAG: sucrase ferredoxin [Actinomycetota bacterium]
MSATERFFCAEGARTRGDPMAGTAPRCFIWVLIEYRGGWPVNVSDLDIEPETKELVFSAAQSVRARVLLVRRHGRRTRKGPGRWAVLRHEKSGAYRQRWGMWSRDEDLSELATAIKTPGETGHPPVILVCTHGRHDPCCAARGRPVGRALSERWPELVWECTHVGGDRFAANVVVVPDGVYYGGLDAKSSVVIIEEHLAGRIHAKHLRGYTDLFQPQQAAVAAALEFFGPAARHDYAIAGTVRDGDQWRVHLTGCLPEASLEVELQTRQTPPCQLTCHAWALSSATAYESTSIILSD